MNSKTPPSFDALVDEAAEAESARPGLALSRAWQGMDLPAIRRDLVVRLLEAGIDEAEIEARHLLSHVLAPASLAAALADPALSSWQKITRLADLATARLSRKPLSQILGSQPFWTLQLSVTPDVLTPRSDTETLVERVLAEGPDGEARVLDLGTGSGAILLALLAERPRWSGLGVDLSAAALEVATCNAIRCGLDSRAAFRAARWGEGLEDHGFDVLVSNPPYIVRKVLAGLEPEVRDHEPDLALDGGEDGLDAYREIASDLARLLKPGGLFAFEIGYDQGDPVSTLMQQAGGVDVTCCADLAGNDRVVLGRMREGNG